MKITSIEVPATKEYQLHLTDLEMSKLYRIIDSTRGSAREIDPAFADELLDRIGERNL